MTIDDLPAIRPRRPIRGLSAVLLPFDEHGSVDWAAFSAHVGRTADAGLIPVINGDAGFVELLDDAARLDMLRIAREALAGREFVGAAFVGDRSGDAFQLKAYLRQIEAIATHGGLPLVCQSFGLAHQGAERVVNDYESLAACCDRFLAMETAPHFDAAGRIYGVDVYEALLGIPQCMGAVCVPVHRMPIWKRLRLRDRTRPDFLVVSGNDLFLDLVTCGNDYLSAISTFAPDWFALRDRMWEMGDVRFFDLNDALQYLACFSTRNPRPAFRHSAAQFLQLRGWIDSDRTHAQSPRRPASDVEVLREVLISIESIVKEFEESGSK